MVAQPVTGLVVEVADLGSLLSALSELRGVVRIHSHGEQVWMRLIHGAVGSVSIDRVAFGMDFDADVGPAGPLVFGHVKSGAVGFRTGDTEHWHTTGDVYLAAQPQHGRTSMVRGGEHDQAIIDPALVSRVAQTAPNGAAGTVRFTGYHAFSQQAAAMWKSVFGYVRDAVLTSPGASDHPLLAANAARLLVTAALAAFPNNALADPTAEDRHDGSSATLRRAVAFIDEHAHEDISVADIAEAAHVTIRAVQLAFRRHLESTPTAYLRRVRLEHAHRQLVAADPEHESVTAVAYRWGFFSPSRFAAYYREAYGVLPSHSLRE
jgi:AraC-like DNA-binding protein